MVTKEGKREQQSTAGNGRFGASGGVFSADNGWVTSSFALVRAFVIPPPASSRRSLAASSVNVLLRKNNKKIVYWKLLS